MNAIAQENEIRATADMRRARSIEDTTRIPIIEIDGSDERVRHAMHAAPRPYATPAPQTTAPARPVVAPAEDVFARSEKKYLVTPEQYARLMEQIQSKLGYDRFGKSLISSLYFDTETDQMVNRSLEKPLYKEKIRVRAYGKVDASDRVFVEMKKKFKGIVYKRRFACSLAAARAYMDGMPYEQAVMMFPLEDEQEQRESISATAQQIAHEIDACKARHPGLRPRTMIVTNRMALRSNDGSDVRITFDIDPVYRNDRLRFEDGFDGDPLRADGSLIMEVKCLGAYPLWLVHALSEAHIYPCPCTKIGQAYQLSHPIERPQVSAEAMAWCAPQPKKNLLTRLSTGAIFGRLGNRKEGASCA